MFEVGNLNKFLLSILSVSLLAGCGGSNGGSSSNPSNPPPPAPTYLEVVNARPTGVGTDLRAPIVINFNQAVKMESLINKQAKIGGLLEELNIELLDITSPTFQVDDLTIAQLEDGLYLPTYTAPDGTTYQLLTATFEWKSTDVGNTLVIKSTNGAPNIEITKDLLDEYDVFAQNSIRVTGSNGTRLKIDLKNGLSTSSSTLEFEPSEGYYRWGTAYTVTVDKGLVDTLDRNMLNNYTFNFTTLVEPDPAITFASPQGGGASVFSDIEITPNFETSVDEAEQAIQVYKETSSGDESLSVGFRYESATRTIIVDPIEELDYSSNYRVEIASSLTGNFDGIPTSLATDYTFTFQTAPPMLLNGSPANGAQNVNPEDIFDLVSLNFNFRPEPTSIDLSTIIFKDSNGVDVQYTFTVVGLAVYLTPVQSLKYNEDYTVTVTTGVYSDRGSELFNSEEVTRTFKTAPTRVISTDPDDGSLNLARRINFNFTTNFDFNNDSISDGGVEVYSSDFPDGPWNTEVVGSWSFSDRTAVFNGSDDIPYNSYVNVKVTSSVTDNASVPIQETSEWTLRVENLELDVADYFPRGDEEAELYDTLWVQFNRPINPATVYWSGFGSIDDSFAVYRTCDENGLDGYIAGDISVDIDVIYFTPQVQLDSNCSYQVTVATDVRGLEGEAQVMQSAFIWDFDTVNLQLIDVFADYVEGTSVVYLDSFFAAIFNRDLTSSSTNGITIYEAGYSSFPEFSWETVSGNELALEPWSDLEPGREYILRLDKDEIFGLDGEQLSEDLYFSFYTQSIEVFVVDWYPYDFDNFIDDPVEIYINIPEIEDEGWPQYDAYLDTSDGYTKYRIEVYQDLDRDGLRGDRVDGEIYRVDVTGDDDFYRFIPDYGLNSDFYFEEYWDYDTRYIVDFEVAYPGDPVTYFFSWYFETELYPITAAASKVTMSVNGEGAGLGTGVEAATAPFTTKVDSVELASNVVQKEFTVAAETSKSKHLEKVLKPSRFVRTQRGPQTSQHPNSMNAALGKKKTKPVFGHDNPGRAPVILKRRSLMKNKVQVENVKGSTKAPKRIAAPRVMGDV